MYKLIVFLIIIYLFFSIFTRYLLPWLLKYFIKRVMKHNLNTDNSFQGKNDAEDENNFKVNIKSKKTAFKPSKKNDEGEYVDYTEIN